MASGLFPRRIETDRLVFERARPGAVDVFELYEFVDREAWRRATEQMPWFRFERVDQVAAFLESAREQFEDGDTARYLLRRRQDDALVGVTGFGPEWEHRRAGSGVVLAADHWGEGYGTERAEAFVELTFERYDLDAYYATCAADNERSRRMIEGYVERYGGRHEGLCRQHSTRPDGSVTDQHRFSVTRAEYEEATADRETLAFETVW